MELVLTIIFIVQNKDLQTKILQSGNIPETVLGMKSFLSNFFHFSCLEIPEFPVHLLVHSSSWIILNIKWSTALDKIKKPLYEKHPMARFAWTITEDTDTVSIISSTVKNNDFFFFWEVLSFNISIFFEIESYDLIQVAKTFASLKKGSYHAKILDLCLKVIFWAPLVSVLLVGLRSW